MSHNSQKQLQTNNTESILLIQVTVLLDFLKKILSNSIYIHPATHIVSCSAPKTE